MADAAQLAAFKTELKGLLARLEVCLPLSGLPGGLQARLGEFRA